MSTPNAIYPPERTDEPPEDDEGCPECGSDVVYVGALLSCTVCDWDASQDEEDTYVG